MVARGDFNVCMIKKLSMELGVCMQMDLVKFLAPNVDISMVMRNNRCMRTILEH